MAIQPRSVGRDSDRNVQAVAIAFMESPSTPCISPEAGFSPGWDTRRLWIKSFKEDALACTIQGEARNNEDIAEFLRRLSLSTSFADVSLVRTGQPALVAGGTPSVSFELKCKVRY